MHTLIVLAVGFALLGTCLLAGLIVAGSNTAMTAAALVFIPLWLIAAAGNMWFGVAKAGYSVKDEFPIFLVIFLIPAAAALAVWWKLKSD